MHRFFREDKIVNNIMYIYAIIMHFLTLKIHKKIL